MKRLIPLLAAAMTAFALPAAAAEKVIEIKDYMFMTVTVHTGDTVTWVNRDDIPHTVIEQHTRLFHSAALDTGDRYSYTFTKAGTYPYFCSLHPQMFAQIIVTDGAVAPPVSHMAHGSPK